MPFVHVSPVAHGLPQPPQLLKSVSGSEHVPPQLFSLVPQHFGSVPSGRVVHSCVPALQTVVHVPQ
jgi:hypothetical protein